MQHRRLGRSGLKVSEISYGNWITHGGQIGEAYIHGLNGVAEGVRLVRGTSTNQPANVDHVLVTAATAVPTSAAILSRDS